MSGSYVLIHGGHHERSCWDHIVTRLESLGHRAVAIDLPGRGDTAELVTSVTLDDWVATIDDAVGGFSTPPTLVAHSMGGVSSSQYADRNPQGIAGIVYVSAVIPADGATAIETLMRAGPESALVGEGVFHVSTDGTTATVDPVRAAEAFYGRCSRDTATAAISRLVPEAVPPLATPLKLGPAFASVPKAYIGALHDRTVPLDQQKLMAERVRATFHALDADHSPFLSAVDDLVTQLVDASERLSP